MILSFTIVRSSLPCHPLLSRAFIITSSQSRTLHHLSSQDKPSPLFTSIPQRHVSTTSPNPRDLPRTSYTKPSETLSPSPSSQDLSAGSETARHFKGPSTICPFYPPVSPSSRFLISRHSNDRPFDLSFPHWRDLQRHHGSLQTRRGLGLVPSCVR
jgi:hypothetical protein